MEKIEKQSNFSKIKEFFNNLFKEDIEENNIEEYINNMNPKERNEIEKSRKNLKDLERNFFENTLNKNYSQVHKTKIEVNEKTLNKMRETLSKQPKDKCKERGDD